VNRRTALFACAAAIAAALSACGNSMPRSLVLADGLGPTHALGVDARVKAFQEHTGRQVKVLRVEAAQALALASRGEADVALVPPDLSLTQFLDSEHGSVAGLFNHNGERSKVLEVSARQHPKVDPTGAHTLAAAFSAP